MHPWISCQKLQEALGFDLSITWRIYSHLRFPCAKEIQERDRDDYFAKSSLLDVYCFRHFCPHIQRKHSFVGFYLAPSNPDRRISISSDLVYRTTHGGGYDIRHGPPVREVFESHAKTESARRQLAEILSEQLESQGYCIGPIPAYLFFYAD